MAWMNAKYGWIKPLREINETGLSDIYQASASVHNVKFHIRIPSSDIRCIPGPWLWTSCRLRAQIQHNPVGLEWQLFGCAGHSTANWAPDCVSNGFSLKFVARTACRLQSQQPFCPPNWASHGYLCWQEIDERWMPMREKQKHDLNGKDGQQWYLLKSEVFAVLKQYQ